MYATSSVSEHGSRKPSKDQTLRCAATALCQPAQIRQEESQAHLAADPMLIHRLSVRLSLCLLLSSELRAVGESKLP